VVSVGGCRGSAGMTTQMLLRVWSKSKELEPTLWQGRLLYEFIDEIGPLERRRARISRRKSPDRACFQYLKGRVNLALRHADLRAQPDQVVVNPEGLTRPS
jgi:hypothetical protein